MFVTEIVSF